jgi:hypothetical protein
MSNVLYGIQVNATFYVKRIQVNVTFYAKRIQVPMSQFRNFVADDVPSRCRGMYSFFRFCTIFEQYRYRIS